MPDPLIPCAAYKDVRIDAYDTEVYPVVDHVLLRLSVTPEAVREHYADSALVRGMTDAELARVGEHVVTSDELYDAFHRCLQVAFEEIYGVDPEAAPAAPAAAPACPECGGSGWAVHPQNGRARNARRCSRGCASRCSVCHDPDCDNPGGQH